VDGRPVIPGETVALRTSPNYLSSIRDPEVILAVWLPTKPLHDGKTSDDDVGHAGKVRFDPGGPQIIPPAIRPSGQILGKN
jgi:hypothetical protein